MRRSCERRSLRLASPDGVDAGAMTNVIGDFLSGACNLGADRDQPSSFKHFDNARNVAEVCDRARAAWT